MSEAEVLAEVRAKLMSMMTRANMRYDVHAALNDVFTIVLFIDNNTKKDG